MNRILIIGIILMAISASIMLTGAFYLEPHATIQFLMSIGGLFMYLIGFSIVLVAPSNTEKKQGEN